MHISQSINSSSDTSDKVLQQIMVID